MKLQSLNFLLIVLYLVWTASVCSAEDKPVGDAKTLYDRLCKTKDAQAALKLGALGAEGAALLNEGLKSGDERIAALCAWAFYHHPQPSAVGNLHALLLKQDEIALTRNQIGGYWAARALGKIGDKSSIPILGSMLSKYEGEVAYWERPEDKLYGGGEANRKKPAPDTPNLRVAYASMEALGEIGGEEAAAVLTRGFKDPQHLIRYGAIRGLAAMKHEPARPLLKDLADGDPVLYVREAARRALEHMDGKNPEKPKSPALPPAVVFFKGKDVPVPNQGFRDFGDFPSNPVYAWGENLFTLTPPTKDGTLKNLTNLAKGGVQGPEVSYDGKRILFGMSRDLEKEGFHIFEINADGSALRQLTDGVCNDVDPCYLPDGRIAFSSDRSGGREEYHHQRTRNIFVMNADGGDIHQITFNPNQDYEPQVLRNGSILYSHYQFYAGKSALPSRGGLGRNETVLHTVMPDGTNDQHFYGTQRGPLYTPLRPQPDGLQYIGANWRHNKEHIGISFSLPRELPDGRIVCMTVSGPAIIDPARSPLDCEIPFFPEIVNLDGGQFAYVRPAPEYSPVGRYTTPYPAGDGWLWISHAPWHDVSRSAYGLYLVHMETRELALVHDEPGVSDFAPVPVAPRPREMVIPLRSESRTAPTGTIECLSVFNTDVPFDKDAVRYVRVIERVRRGVSIVSHRPFPARVLATVPIEKDGSFFVEAPADTPVQFELLDADGNILVHETTHNYVRGGEHKACMGCHEPKAASPDAAADPLALRHGPYPALRKPGDPIYKIQVLSRGYNMIIRP
ncbi:MAG: HEAT repeat domain-containing protein [Planctomycetota bacterium]